MELTNPIDWNGNELKHELEIEDMKHTISLSNFYSIAL